MRAWLKAYVIALITMLLFVAVDGATGNLEEVSSGVYIFIFIGFGIFWLLADILEALTKK